MYVVGLDADIIYYLAQLVSLCMVTYILLFNYMPETLYIFKIIIHLFINKYLEKFIILFNKIINFINNKQSASNFYSMTYLLSIDSSLNNWKLSEHRPLYKKLKNEEILGYYLAGLIEGDGNIGLRIILISINYKDIKNAYYLKKLIGYGRVIKYSHTDKAVRLIFGNKEARKRVFNLINGKLLGPYKHQQLIDQKYNIEFNIPIKPITLFDLLSNPWLTGFSDADGSFGIDIVKSKLHKVGFNVRLTFRIKQKYDYLLKHVQNVLGGHIYIFNKGTNIKIYQYSSINFKIATNVIKYFNKYPPLHNSKYIHYLKWYKVYLLIQDKKHLTQEGIDKIKFIKRYFRD